MCSSGEVKLTHISEIRQMNESEHLRNSGNLLLFSSFLYFSTFLCSDSILRLCNVSWVCFVRKNFEICRWKLNENAVDEDRIDVEISASFSQYSLQITLWEVFKIAVSILGNTFVNIFSLSSFNFSIMLLFFGMRCNSFEVNLNVLMQ